MSQPCFLILEVFHFKRPTQDNVEIVGNWLVPPRYIQNCSKNKTKLCSVERNIVLLFLIFIRKVFL